MLTIDSEVSYGPQIATAFEQATGTQLQVLYHPMFYDRQGLRPGSVDVIWTADQLEAQLATEPHVTAANGQRVVERVEHALAWQPSVDFNALGSQFASPEHTYFPTGVEAAAAVVYDPAHLPAGGLPAAWADLAGPSYRGEVAMTSIFYTNINYATVTGIAQLLGGANQGMAFLRQLKAQDTVFPSSDAQTLAAVEAGKRSIAVVSDGAYYEAKAEGKRLAIAYPAPGTIGVAATLLIPVEGHHRTEAEQFVNWVLSPAGQAALAERAATGPDAYFLPVITGAPPGLPRDTTVLGTYHLATWVPQALTFRLGVDASVQPAAQAVLAIDRPPSFMPTTCRYNCSLCGSNGCDP